MDWLAQWYSTRSTTVNEWTKLRDEYEDYKFDLNIRNIYKKDLTSKYKGDTMSTLNKEMT